MFFATTAPIFSAPPGAVSSGFKLEISHANADGTIYFTVDGSDPRLVGGNVSPAALPYTSAIPVRQRTQVRARVLSASEWSPIMEGYFVTPTDYSNLVFTEIHYHPLDADTQDGDQFEFEIGRAHV